MSNHLETKKSAMYLKCWTCRVQTGVREDCGWLAVVCGGGGGYPIHLQCIYISYFQLRAAELHQEPSKNWTLTNAGTGT